MTVFSPLSPYLGLSFGIACMAGASILIRLADAPSFVIAAYRLAVAAGILLPFAYARARTELARLTWPFWRLGLLAGLLLAAHFATWISSLTYTSVASSVVLVSTSPIFVGLASRRLLGERLSFAMFAGILVAVIGGGVIGYGDFDSGGQALWGDVLALAGAMTGAGYFMIGRRLRPHLSLLAYITVVYGTAAVMLIGLAGAAGHAMTGYGWTTCLIFAALAVGPQLLGHSALNWALRYLSAAFVSVSTLGEPVGATILAAVILGEGVSAVKTGGGLLVLGGIYLALRAERQG